jgi:hypothetical protein
MIDKDMMVLQSYTNSENVLVGPHGEIYPACHDGSQAMNIKVEEGSDAGEEADPVPITVLEMKAKPEVSCICLCMSAVRQTSQTCRNASCLSNLHLCTHERTPL